MQLQSMPKQKRQKAREHTWKATVRDRRRMVAYFLKYRSVYIVARRLGLDKRMVKYWVLKYFNAEYHNKQLGGNKNGMQSTTLSSSTIALFSIEELPLLKNEILHFLERHPTAKEAQLREHLAIVFRRPIAHSTCGRYLRQLGWSWKVPTKFQLNKYTFSNLMYYCTYLQLVIEIPLDKLKFCDEAHIVSKDLGKKYGSTRLSGEL